MEINCRGEILLQHKETFKPKSNGMDSEEVEVAESVETDIAQLTHMNILWEINCLVKKRGWL